MGILLRPWAHFVDFGGRSRRLELLLFYLLIWVAIVAIFYFGAPPSSQGGSAVEAGMARAVLAALTVLAVATIPAFALTVRRLHDCDQPGWYVVSALIPLLFALLTLYLLIQPGSEGHNSYGADPRSDPRAIDLQKTFE